MGYPMGFKRFMQRTRSHFHGAVSRPDLTTEIIDNWYMNGIGSDLHRLQTDARDTLHLQGYAHLAHTTPEQVKIILDAFFEDALSIGSQLLCDGRYIGVLFDENLNILVTHDVAMPPGTMLVFAQEQQKSEVA